MKKIYVGLLASLWISGSALAATGVLVANVTQVLVDDANYGGCMVRLDTSPTTIVAGCAESFLTLDCTGDFTSKSKAQRKLDSANLSLVTGKRMAVYFTDASKHNGYCLATRIDTVAN